MAYDDYQYPDMGSLTNPPTVDTISKRYAAAPQPDPSQRVAPFHLPDLGNIKMVGMGFGSAQAAYPGVTPMKNGGANEVDTQTSGSVSQANPQIPPSLSGNYTPDTGWGFRNKIAAGGKPGEQITNDYGPGYGNAKVTATADKNGKFNSFSDAPGAPGTAGGPAQPQLSPVQLQMQQLRQQIAYHKAQGGLLGRINASNAQKQLNVLQNQAIAEGHLQVQQGQLDLQRTDPGRAYQGMLNAVLQAPGGIDILRKLQQAHGGEDANVTLQGINTTLRAPRDQAGAYPTIAVPGQPISVQPLNFGENPLDRAVSSGIR